MQKGVLHMEKVLPSRREQAGAGVPRIFSLDFVEVGLAGVRVNCGYCAMLNSGKSLYTEERVVCSLRISYTYGKRL